MFTRWLWLQSVRAGRGAFISGIVGAAAMAALQPLPALAIPTNGGGNTPCASKITASLNAQPAAIHLDPQQPPPTVTLTWNVQWQTGCKPTWMRLYYRDFTTGVLIATDVSDTAVGPSGTLVDHPPSSGSYFVRALVNGWLIDFGSGTVSVALPVVNGKTTVDITQPNRNGLFAQAIAVPDAVVRIAGNLDLDLSFMSNLFVAPGVQILGDRSEFRAGPRLFTTSFPRELLKIGVERDSDDGTVEFDPSDHVRISGIRLDGGESDDPFSAVGQDDADGIAVYSSQDVQIDHNEIYRWRGAAVNVHDGTNSKDSPFVGRINRDNSNTVSVQDNYIHHNQHPSSNHCLTSPFEGDGHAAGYGVVVSDGAYALIERNVFDWNRHSIAGDGKPGTGYQAYNNLILTHGGVHFRCIDNSNFDGLELLFNPFAGLVYVVRSALDDGLIYHTHAIDMHGVNSCGISTGDLALGDHNCGPAGEFMDIAFNTILYTAGNGIHLRGTPADRMDVRENVFAHEDHDGSFLSPGAMVQNETGLHDSNNTLGLNTFNDRKSCDFDGDGVDDPMIATGANLWYASSVLGGRWVFLAQARNVRINDVTLGDLDGDGRCDAVALGHVFLNPDPLPLVRSPGQVSIVVGTPVAFTLSATGGSRPYSWTVTGLPPGLSANAAGQISGVPAGSAAPSYLVTATAKDVQGQIGRATFAWTVTASVPDLLGEELNAAQSLVGIAGLKVGRVSYNNTCVDPGFVSAQSPNGGVPAPIGSSVDITVASCSSRGGGGGTTHPQ